jgi:glycine C-acetyltransferase
LTQLGFHLGRSNTHIMPPNCGDEAKALFMHVALLESGVMMVPLVYPSVKRGDERLRLNVTRGHTREDMDKALSLLGTYGRAFYVIE